MSRVLGLWYGEIPSSGHLSQEGGAGRAVLGTGSHRGANGELFGVSDTPQPMGMGRVVRVLSDPGVSCDSILDYKVGFKENSKIHH